MKTNSKLLFLSLCTLSLSSCMGAPKGAYNNYFPVNQGYDFYPSEAVYDGENVKYENPYVDVSEQRTNNISLTSSTFAYPSVREAINQNRYDTAKNYVRTEEMLNYFSYNYVNDTDDALTTKLELAECPWNEDTYLASVVVKAQPAKIQGVKNNIVILVDRSGSMSDIFSLVKTSLHTLVSKLTENDTVSMVSYASGMSIECEALTGKDKNKLNKIINNMTASGGTYGEGGIEKAYEIAYKHFIEGGNNRVVLLTDGDFNIGKVSGDELTKLIKNKAADGMYLTCCGYRSHDNSTLYTLSENGNGNAYYIDGELEATKVFEEEFGKSMFVVAKDSKCQVEFSDDVTSYRLLGYENRQMSDDEFNDDKKDAGEIMSDHTTVALYELNLKEERTKDYIFKTTLRYKDPLTNENKEITNIKNDISVSRQSDYAFASYVAEYCLTLIDSQYKGLSSYDHLLERINSNYINDGYRDDFVSIVRKSQQLSSDDYNY